MSSPTPLPLPITIRFTTSIPDLLLNIASPETTTVIALKHQIRLSLSAPTSKQRLRLIHAGKLLPDSSPLSSVLKTPPPPPPRAPDPKGKGKAVDLPAPRVYINCSIGDVLTSAELSAEALKASESGSKSTKGGGKDAAGAGAGKSESNPSRLTTTTTPAPRGFDRLLSGGFTPAEVNQLRLQFLSIQANIHTPDTMPSPETLRRMEDAWIDDNQGNAGTGAGGGGNGGFDFGDDGMGGGALDDILWGNIMGFLWPLGSIWVMREGGVWSRRRQIAVFTGFVLSLTFGMLRVVS